MKKLYLTALLTAIVCIAAIDSQAQLLEVGADDAEDVSLLSFSFEMEVSDIDVEIISVPNDHPIRLLFESDEAIPGDEPDLDIPISQGSLDLSASDVPEPSAVAIVIVGGGVFLLWRHRSRIQRV